jgi:hypothetical protein
MSLPKKRRHLVRTVVTGVAAALVIMGKSVTATPAYAAAYLGRVDMQRACATQYPASWGLSAQVNHPYKANSWRCWAPWDHWSYGIDVHRACANQYGEGAYAGLGNINDPYSWYCRRGY